MIFGKTSNVTNGFDVLLKERFIVVNRDESADPEWEVNFDLEGQRYFGNLRAIDSEAVYGVDNGTEAFKRYVADYLSIFNNLELSPADIKAANYRVEKEILPLLKESEFEKELPTNFEADYLNAGLKKVRIDYNKQFLPVKVEGFYDGSQTVEEGWRLLRTLSYPYNNKKQFDKALAEHIQLIEELEEENE